MIDTDALVPRQIRPHAASHGLGTGQISAVGQPGRNPPSDDLRRLTFTEDQPPPRYRLVRCRLGHRRVGGDWALKQGGHPRWRGMHPYLDQFAWLPALVTV